MQSIAMNKKYIRRSASNKSSLSCQRQSLLSKKICLQFSSIVGVLFLAFFIPKFAFATEVVVESDYSQTQYVSSCGGGSLLSSSQYVLTATTTINSVTINYKKDWDGYGLLLFANFTGGSVCLEGGNPFKWAEFSPVPANDGFSTKTASTTCTLAPDTYGLQGYSGGYSTRGANGSTATCENPWEPYLALDLNIEPTPPENTSTRLISFNPYQNQVLETGTTTISGSFYNQQKIYNKLIVNLSYVEPSVNSNFLLSQDTYKQFIFDIATSTSDQNFSTTTNDLITGRWLVNASFSDGTTGTNYFTATSSTFVIGTTTTFYSDFVYSTTTNYGQVSNDCKETLASTTAPYLNKIVCWMADRTIQGMQYLFSPSGEVLNMYAQEFESVKHRAPMIYVQQMPELMATLYNSALNGTSSAISVQTKFVPNQGTTTITFLSRNMIANIPMTEQIQTALKWLLWMMLMFTVYKTVASLYDDKTPNV